jgi:DNA methylase
MGEGRQRALLNLSSKAEQLLVTGARDTSPVKGLTHDFYKYPARFSPAFARSAISAFTQRGDICLDPHVGGGTSLVEALSLGRHAIGIDISPLAEFVSKTKTTLLSDKDFIALERWISRVLTTIDVRKPSSEIGCFAELGYYKHLNHPERWRIRKAIEQAIASAVRFQNDRLEAFARCAVLRTAQWALDGRKVVPSIEEFRNGLRNTATEMLRGARSLSLAVKDMGRARPRIQVINRSAAGADTDARLANSNPPKLVLTSPPYPGVHVLYHRWQVDGRKEAPLPFMIANKLDGAGSSYYTMGDRKYPELKTYFDNIEATMSSVTALSTFETTFVQMVAFSEPSWQLPRYIETMEAVGLREVFLKSLQNEGDGRLWRSVPGRRWYSHQRGQTPGSQEVVLFHLKDGRFN